MDKINTMYIDLVISWILWFAKERLRKPEYDSYRMYVEKTKRARLYRWCTGKSYDFQTKHYPLTKKQRRLPWPWLC